MEQAILEAHQHLAALRKERPPFEWDDELRRGFAASALELSRNMIVPFYPPVIYIEPTNACNANCIMCPRRNMKRPVGLMDMPLYQSILEQIAQAGPSELRLFNFGEPLLHPHLPEMISQALTYKLAPRIQTNGILLTDEMIDRLLAAGLDYLGISINCIKPEEYVMIRPGHSFPLLERNLRALRAKANERGGAFHIHINAHMLKDELETRRGHIAQMTRYWSGVADSISVSGLSLHEDVQLWGQDTIFKVSLDDHARTPDSKLECTEPFDRLVIKWDGRVTPCCADFDAVYVVGDMRTDTLDEVWHSPTMESLRETVKQRRYKECALCRDCCKLYSRQFNIHFKR